MVCEDCQDTRRVPIYDDDDTTDEEPIHFTDCWTCNNNGMRAWDDTRCPECGGPFEYPRCERGCFG